MKAKIGDVEYRSWKEAAARHGISYTCFINRVHNEHWDRARAATQPVHVPILHTAAGFTGTRKDHAKRLGVADATLTKRLQRGATIDDALTLYPARRKFSDAQERRIAEREADRESRALKAAAIRDYKNRPCKDCGGRFDTDAMEFDHCRGQKKFQLSNASGKSLLAIAQEIAKCDVVCAVCHRARTKNRRLQT